MGSVREKIMSLSKASTIRNFSKPTHVSMMYGGQKKPRKPKIKKQSEDKIKESQDRIIRDIKNLLEQEEDYCKPVRVRSLFSNIYIEYENNGDRNKTLSIKEYHDEIKPYLKDINNLKKSDA